MNIFERISVAYRAFRTGELRTESQKKKPKQVSTPANGGRSSMPEAGNPYDYSTLTSNLKLITPSYLLELIPEIRKLSIANPDISQALHNITTLANTGHKITFDQKAPPDEVDKMRTHLKVASRNLLVGTPGIDGIVNKMLSQIIIGGALSVEFVPKMDLTGFETVVFVNPESIRWVLNTRTYRYEPYQLVPSFYQGVNPKELVAGNLKKLNPITFQYYGYGGDTDSPYGIPPYLAALDAIETQDDMKQNIRFIVKQMGLLGFLTMMLEKPDIIDGESEPNYKARLDALLTEAKGRTTNSFKDGVIVGYKGDTEFELHSAVDRDTTGAEKLFQSNEQQIASGVKQDTSMWGRSYGTTESQITVVFTKMLSEFKNLHNILAAVLEYYYRMELTMQGFKYAESVKVTFNRSTLSDDLKFQQADEIKIRNLSQLYWDGIISLETYADEMGKVKPDATEPRLIPNTGQTPAQIAEQKAQREKAKDASDRKVRSKNKPADKKLT